jgi:UTP--glucose-1-phosphate uridylyltransferase
MYVVIPAAGLGTRMKPATLAFEKELLPLGTEPLLKKQIRAAAAAGFTHVVLVVGPSKFDLLKYCHMDPDIEQMGVQVHVAVQQEAKGLGHAVLCASSIVPQTEPFAVLLPDDWVVTETPLLTQLMAAYNAAGKNKGVCALMEVPAVDLPKFGIVGGTMQGELLSIDHTVEKPMPHQLPYIFTGTDRRESNLAIVAAYIFPPMMWELLRSTLPGAGGEIQLTDAMGELSRVQVAGLVGAKFKGMRFDCGNPLGYAQAFIHSVLSDATSRGPLLEWLKTQQ